MKLSKSDRDRYVETQRLIRQAAEDRMQAWIDEARDERIAESYRDINDVPQWVAYRMEERNGRFTKVPVNPVTGGNAQTNNPSTWGTLAQAQAAAARYGTDGVGFVFANGYFGIDLDHVIDPENKTIKQYAQDIIDTMASYTEISPSGTGVHIIARGDPVLDSNVNKNIGIEIYYPTMQDDGSIRRGRYFTVTGNSYGPVRPVSERTEQAQDIWKRYVDGKPTYPGTMVSAAENLGFSNDMSAMVDYAYGLSTQYGEASSALACEMYDALAEAQGATVPPAEPAATATYDETAKAVSGTMKNRRNSVPDTVSRLVKQAAADTMLQNAKRDRAEFAWIPRGDTCAFCIMLASNGWQYQSRNAMKNGHASHIHANCDCEYVVRFDGKSTVEGYDPDEYLAMYENAEGATWKEKLNSMRRAQYAEDKDRINAQKRAAYARRKEWEKAAPIITNTPRKPDKPTYGCRDVTREWLDSATPNSHPVRDLTVFTQDGFTYTVDGWSVKLDYGPHEKEIAELLESTLGGEIWMVPRVNDPENINTPDYLFRRERYDLKTMRESKSKNAVYNRINDSQKQAENFVLDITSNPLGRAEIIRQAEGIFQSYHSRGVQRIVLIDNKDIILILERN